VQQPVSSTRQYRRTASSRSLWSPSSYARLMSLLRSKGFVGCFGTERRRFLLPTTAAHDLEQSVLPDRTYVALQCAQIRASALPCRLPRSAQLALHHFGFCPRANGLVHCAPQYWQVYASVFTCCLPEMRKP